LKLSVCKNESRDINCSKFAYTNNKVYQTCNWLDAPDFKKKGAFRLAAILNIFGGNDTSMGIVWLCLGSTFLCPAPLYLKKNKENDE